MTRHLLNVVSFIVAVCIVNIFGQCAHCPNDYACCLSRTSSEWSCCPVAALPSPPQPQSTPWNFHLQIKYDNYVWDCSPSTLDPTEASTNVSCLLDGRWSLNRVTFQLRSVPANGFQAIYGEYTMKNGHIEKIAFQADNQWALTVPVDKNEHAGIYDKIQFKYGGFNYTYYCGYGAYPHCPRC